MKRELAQKILEAAQPYLEKRTVTDLVLGIALIGVELDHKRIGVAYMLRDDLPSGCGSFGFAQQAIGKDAWSIAQLLVEGTDDAQRGLAAALLNAASHDVALPFCCDDEEHPFGTIVQSNDKLGMIGFMAPVAKRFKNKVADIAIFDRGRELAGYADTTPCNLQSAVLPECAIMTASGTTITNHTLEGLLDMASRKREVVLIGTSTPLFPDAYIGSGVTSLAGTLWNQDAKDEIFRTIALGGGIMVSRPFRSNVCVRIPDAPQL